MLEWQLRGLAEVGVAEAVVITGFRSEKVEAALERIAPPGMAVDPLQSLLQGRRQPGELLDGARRAARHLPAAQRRHPVRAKVARRLLDAPAAPITLTIDRKPRYDDDDMKVITEGDKLRAVGKKLSEGVNGESIGFSRFQGDGAAIFVAELERTMRTKEGTSLWYLSAINRLASSGADVRVVSIEGLDWASSTSPPIWPRRARSRRPGRKTRPPRRSPDAPSPACGRGWGEGRATSCPHPALSRERERERRRPADGPGRDRPACRRRWRRGRRSARRSPCGPHRRRARRCRRGRIGKRPSA